MAKQIVPNLSVDCVIFGFDSKELKVLLVERILANPLNNKIVFSDLTLTGYHIMEDENLDQAAERILYDLTGLHDIYLEQFYTFGELDRLKNKNDKLWLTQYGDSISKRVVSVGYFSLIDNSKAKIQFKNRVVQWFPVYQVKNLAYDHKHILNKALEALRNKLLTHPIAFELLPDKFTLGQLQKLYEVILHKKFDKRNFRKKISQMSFVIPIKEKKAGGAGKPAQLYIFSKDAYNKTKTNKLFLF